MWHWIKNIAGNNHTSRLSSAAVMIERLESRELFSISPAAATTTKLLAPPPIVHPQVTANPLLGTYSGKLTRLTDSKTFAVKVVVSQKGSKIALEATLTLTGLGTVELGYIISPSSTGTFVQNLGPNANWGTMRGHLNKGVLVLAMLVPGNSPISGNLKRVT